MSKFSSYPEQQLIFENWRRFSLDEELQTSNLLESIQLTEEQEKNIKNKLDEIAGFGALKGKSTTLEILEGVLWIIGMIPGIGIPADILSAVLLYFRGDMLGSAFSLLAALPAIGMGAAAVRAGIKLKGKAAGFKALKAFLLKTFADTPEVIFKFIKKKTGKAVEETSQVTTWIVKKYYSKNPKEGARIINKINEELQVWEWGMFKYVWAPVLGTSFAKGFIGGGEEEEGGEESAPVRIGRGSKIIYDKNDIKVVQQDEMYVLIMDGESIGTYSLERLEKTLPPGGWLKNN